MKANGVQMLFQAIAMHQHVLTVERQNMDDGGFDIEVILCVISHMRYTEQAVVVSTQQKPQYISDFQGPFQAALRYSVKSCLNSNVVCKFRGNMKV